MKLFHAYNVPFAVYSSVMLSVPSARIDYHNKTRVRLGKSFRSTARTHETRTHVFKSFALDELVVFDRLYHRTWIHELATRIRFAPSTLVLHVSRHVIRHCTVGLTGESPLRTICLQCRIDITIYNFVHTYYDAWLWERDGRTEFTKQFSLLVFQMGHQDVLGQDR